jgi:hypothetical protein
MYSPLIRSKVIFTVQTHWHFPDLFRMTGNDADYVLVSVVRTTEPGFLRSLNRMNVMLTRARKGMVIVTSAPFLHSGEGATTLLGKLSHHWEHTGGVPWIDSRRVADGTTSLPGSTTEDAHATSRRRAFMEAQFPPLSVIPRSTQNTVVTQQAWGRQMDPEAQLSGVPHPIQMANSTRQDLFGQINYLCAVGIARRMQDTISQYHTMLMFNHALLIQSLQHNYYALWALATYGS